MANERKRYSEEHKGSWCGSREAAEVRKSWRASTSRLEQTIRNWVKQSELDDGSRSDGLTSEERQELARLRRENARLKEEREILSKAAAWFAQETTGVDPVS